MMPEHVQAQWRAYERRNRLAREAYWAQEHPVEPEPVARVRTETPEQRRARLDARTRRWRELSRERKDAINEQRRQAREARAKIRTAHAVSLR